MEYNSMSLPLCKEIMHKWMGKLIGNSEGEAFVTKCKDHAGEQVVVQCAECFH